MSDDDQIEEAPAPKKSKMIPALLVVNTLLVGGVLVFTLTRKSGPPAAHAETAGKAEHGAKTPAEGDGHAGPTEKAAAMGPTVRLENFVVQLRAVEAERYAHISLELELTNESGKSSVSALLPKVRDSIIGYLSDRTADELRGSDGMARLKEAVLTRMNDILPARTVVGVYVTDFIVQ